MTRIELAKQDAPLVSVMIVAYQAREVIDDCLRSIMQSDTEASIEVLLIDNGTDGTGNLVAENYPAVKIVPTRGNIGFGAGNNAIAEFAKGKYLLLLNPDTIVEPGAIDALLSFARERDDALAWGGLIKTPNGTPDVSNFLRLPTLEQLLYAALGLERLYTRKNAPDDANAERTVEALCGAFFMIRLLDYRRFGGFDESFFLYSEEMDLFARIANEGGTVLTTPASGIVHLIGTSGTMSEGRAIFKAKGLMHFARKHWSAPKVVAAAALIWLAAFERSLVGLTRCDRSSRIAQLGKVSWAICRRPSEWIKGYSNRNSGYSE